MNTKVQLRDTPFRRWFKRNLKESARDIALHGADAGYSGIIYYRECVKLYNKYEDDIYDMLNEDADAMGYESPEELIATFRRKDMLSSPDQRKNLLVWYAAEKVSREKHPDL